MVLINPVSALCPTFLSRLALLRNFFIRNFKPISQMVERMITKQVKDRWRSKMTELNRKKTTNSRT